MPIGGGASTQSRGVKTGTFIYVAHANDPGDNAGEYLECNGQNVSRTTYAALYAKIGTTWGVGDGITTFTLPDARRRSPVGAGGAGTATLGNAVGNTGGSETHTITTANLPAVTFTYEPGGATGQGFTTPGTNNQSSFAGSATAMNIYSPSYICGVWIKT